MPAPEAERVPLVAAAKIDNALRLTAVDREASGLGLAPGMTLAAARARVPDLRAVPADAAADRALLERLADWCDQISPFVACVPPRTLLLDLTGAAHLFGGDAATLERVRARLTRQGFAVRGAIAGTAAAARALARYRDGACIAPGAEAAALAPLPVEALALDPAATYALRRAGLKTVGQVAARGRAELAARFGAPMVFACDHALGVAETPITPRRPLPDYSVEQRFAEPIVTEARALATLKDLAARLSEVLEQRGQGARRLEARFFRTDGNVRHIGFETAQPLRAPDIIERLFREKLAALNDPLDPGFGYDLIRLCAARAERSAPKALSLHRGSDEEDALAQLIDRLSARFGPERLLAFRPNDTHIPERSVLAVPAQTAGDTQISWDRIREPDDVPRRPIRLFARPSPIEVISEIPDGPPVRFRWRRVLHRVERAEGPERIAMEWWRHETARPTRDYYRLEDSEGRRFWVFRNGLYERETAAPQWFVHGVFA